MNYTFLLIDYSNSTLLDGHDSTHTSNIILSSTQLDNNTPEELLEAISSHDNLLQMNSTDQLSGSDADSLAVLHNADPTAPEVG